MARNDSIATEVASEADCSFGNSSRPDGEEAKECKQRWHVNILPGFSLQLTGQFRRLAGSQNGLSGLPTRMHGPVHQDSINSAPESGRSLTRVTQEHNCCSGAACECGPQISSDPTRDVTQAAHVA